MLALNYHVFLFFFNCFFKHLLCFCIGTLAHRPITSWQCYGNFIKSATAMLRCDSRLNSVPFAMMMLVWSCCHKFTHVCASDFFMILVHLWLISRLCVFMRSWRRGIRCLLSRNSVFIALKMCTRLHWQALISNSPAPWCDVVIIILDVARTELRFQHYEVEMYILAVRYKYKVIVSHHVECHTKQSEACKM